MKADRIANFSCIWFERRTEIVNFSSRKKSGLYLYYAFETFQLTFHHLYCDVGCYGMVLYGVLCNTKTQKWKVISEERSKKERNSLFQTMSKCSVLNCESFYPIFLLNNVILNLTQFCKVFNFWVNCSMLMGMWFCQRFFYSLEKCCEI